MLLYCFPTDDQAATYCCPTLFTHLSPDTSTPTRSIPSIGHVVVDASNPLYCCAASLLMTHPRPPAASPPSATSWSTRPPARRARPRWPSSTTLPRTTSTAAGWTAGGFALRYCWRLNYTYGRTAVLLEAKSYCGRTAVLLEAELYVWSYCCTAGG